jgi:hypothetical protein
MVQEAAMRIDLGVIKRHCHDTGCGDCELNRSGCMFRVPPEQWRVEVMELAILKIATDKARKAIEGRMGE